VTFASAQKNVELLREEAALELMARIGPECPTYYPRALAKVQEYFDRVVDKKRQECNRYAHDHEYKTAVEVCETYMKYACQKMKGDELQPPPNAVVSLGLAPLRKNQWRPKDPLIWPFFGSGRKPTQGHSLGVSKTSWHQ